MGSFNLNIKDELAPAPKGRERLASIVSFVKTSARIVGVAVTLTVLGLYFLDDDWDVSRVWEMIRSVAKVG
ncbi:hypothetical protein [Rhodoblastus sp.]|uniref:hypothetical protein n=1 Tax=Rhodoblastus sp. TaxID=1962975 RepID=UPI003F9E88E6